MFPKKFCSDWVNSQIFCVAAPGQGLYLRRLIFHRFIASLFGVSTDAKVVNFV